MSDANTDLARENRRACFYAYYLNALEAYLKDPVEDRWHAVLSRAKEADSVKGGFLSGPTSFEERASELMIGLVRDDKDCWARFLFSLEDSDYFQKFKAISPFADQMLVAVDYGFGFVNIRGDFQSFIDSLIDGDWGMKTYGGEKYVVVLNEPTKDSADVICVGCGIKGASGPRSVKE